jgi:hypothetical protein
MGMDGAVNQSGKHGSLSVGARVRSGEGRPRAPYRPPTLSALLIERSAGPGGTSNDGVGQGAGNAGGFS